MARGSLARWISALRRGALAVLGLIALTLGIGMTLPGCRVGYVVRSAWYQGELLASRRPIEEVRASGELSSAQLHALDLVDEVKAYGERMGLKPTRNYGTVAWGWDRQIWNVTACDPLAFRPETWWFPIVGRVPYLGYFKVEHARETEARLRAEGLDVYARTAGAYSTLGWFRDPILPGMLEWDEFDLADTVLHELAHATLWVPGSVHFNESFANFVGEEAAFQYLKDKYGPESPPVVAARQEFEDLARWRALQQALVGELDAVYQDAALSDAQKLERKAALFASLPERVSAAGFHTPDRFLRAATQGTWNNARLVQFKTYNTNRGAFEAVLARHNGDLLAFMREVGEITRGADDPFAALEAATATP